MFAPHSRHEVGREVGFPFKLSVKSVIPICIGARKAKAETHQKRVKIRLKASRADKVTASKPIFLDLKLWLKVMGKHRIESDTSRPSGRIRCC